jgi:hypothetical protein
MKAFRRCSLLALAGVCLLMASCFDSKEPISDPQKATVDPALLGVWRKTNTDNHGTVQYCHIGRFGDKMPGVLRAIAVTHAKSGFLSGPGEFIFFSSKVGNNRFFNVTTASQQYLHKLTQKGWDASLIQGYFLFKYELQDDTLTVWGFDKDAKRRAIQAGKIKGMIEKDKNGNESVHFTDTSEHIAAMLASPDGANLLSKEPIRYQRVK